ncbi:peroxiredoxin family protein [Sandaracinus amylolyticus]|uniref:peroxiredoxin family protein n=1 Tax=Sandaracinus amylolyticus TaxID=927083 RepID=UPI001F389087|nr:hypothetical protein [Sandaracinus amylolyticus]UJR82609.1 Hypothetical protein I5071_46740 [Sandaracinus amylolyticus]
MTRRAALLAMIAALSAATLARAQLVEPPSEPGDFSLEETSGQTRTLASVRGRVVIVFYEDRDHTSVNHAFKETLHRFVIDNHLQQQATTYAVADVHGIDGIVRDMARGAIRTIAQRYGIQILLDWDGALRRAPFSLRGGEANVALIDRQGRVRWRHAGAIGETERTSFFRTFRQLLREPAPTP